MMRMRSSFALGRSQSSNDPFSAWRRFSLVFVIVLALLILLALGFSGGRW